MYALGSCGSAAASTAVAATTKVADSDGDGIADNVDECPYVAGKPEFFGCPDSDGDGLGDSKDKCPFDKGSAANQGCPDAATTPNTVAPTTPTTPTETPAAPAKQNKLVQGFEVFFANGTTFAPNQVETLQKVATLLKNNPNYTVVINGNAYKGGSKALSLQRAEKVAGALRMKGVNVSNAKTEGFGDTRAKYNNTKDNRAEIEPIIVLKDASIYQNDFLVLNSVNLNIEAGEFVYLIGKTGSGKSSLLKTLYGELPLNVGEGTVNGFTLNTSKPRKIYALRRSLGIV
ncbi:hypothetical protein CWI39_3752p0010, partial [Hamiltosporidium magnivora]